MKIEFAVNPGKSKPFSDVGIGEVFTPSDKNDYRYFIKLNNVISDFNSFDVYAKCRVDIPTDMMVIEVESVLAIGAAK